MCLECLAKYTCQPSVCIPHMHASHYLTGLQTAPAHLLAPELDEELLYKNHNHGAWHGSQDIVEWVGEFEGIRC